MSYETTALGRSQYIDVKLTTVGIWTRKRGRVYRGGWYDGDWECQRWISLCWGATAPTVMYSGAAIDPAKRSDPAAWAFRWFAVGGVVPFAGLPNPVRDALSDTSRYIRTETGYRLREGCELCRCGNAATRQLNDIRWESHDGLLCDVCAHKHEADELIRRGFSAQYVSKFTTLRMSRPLP